MGDAGFLHGNAERPHSRADLREQAFADGVATVAQGHLEGEGVGGIPPLQGVHVLCSRVSIMSFSLIT
jgi:hypothetical protein